MCMCFGHLSTANKKQIISIECHKHISNANPLCLLIIYSEHDSHFTWPHER